MEKKKKSGKYQDRLISNTDSPRLAFASTCYTHSSPDAGAPRYSFSLALSTHLVMGISFSQNVLLLLLCCWVSFLLPLLYKHMHFTYIHKSTVSGCCHKRQIWVCVRDVRTPIVCQTLTTPRQLSGRNCLCWYSVAQLYLLYLYILYTPWHLISLKR